MRTLPHFWAFLFLVCCTPVFAQTTVTVPGPTIKLGWTGPTANTAGAALTGATTYNVYQGACNPTATFSKVQTGIAGNSAVVSAGVTAGTTYGFRVTAVNAGVESAQTPTVCAMVSLPLTPPNPPTALTVLPN